MIERREFVGLVGAGTLFPAEFAKALTKPLVSSEATPDWRGLHPPPRSPFAWDGWHPDDPFVVPPVTRVVCFGNDWDPVSVEQLTMIGRSFRIHESRCRWRDLHPRQYVKLRSIAEIATEFGTSVKAIYAVPFPLNRWIVGIGSDDRPAQESDCIAVQEQIIEIAKIEDWEHSTLITHHNFYPHEFFGAAHVGYTLRFPPMVKSHKWTEKALGCGSYPIRKVAPRWITQTRDPFEYCDDE